MLPAADREMHAHATASGTAHLHAPSAPKQSQALYPPPASLAASAHVKCAEEYERMYERSIRENDAFWKQMAETHISWGKPFHTVKREGVHGTPDTEWFLGGQLNVSYNCVDRHAASDRGDKRAIIWESDDGKEERHITYKQLHAEVQRTANVLKSLGVKEGTTVALYMPMVPETVFTMLACARLGAQHNCVFAGFSAEAFRERVRASSAQVVVCSDEMYRGGKRIPLKDVVDSAVSKGCDTVRHVLVLRRTGGKVAWTEGRDKWWHEEMERVEPTCPPVAVDSEHPLFCLFTSGSTGKPKGLVHTSGGYLTYAAVTARYAFDIHDQDVYACMADLGWITGHSYIVYGPLALGATTLLFEGHPTYPHAGRYWEMVEKHKISIFYTSPTAVRSLMGLGEEAVKRYDRSSLRVLGSVGEPINPEAWRWLHKHVGDSNAPLVDTYWQTETGGIILCPLPGATTLKAGSACHPMFGVEVGLYDEHGREVPFVKGRESEGLLCIKRPWPGLARTILGDHDRYLDVYFRHFKSQPGLYITGDQARRDGDGYYWITGRVDDVINVSGHRISSAEVESALALHPRTVEAAVVSMPHPLKGEALCAFIVTKGGTQAAGDPVAEIQALVTREIGKLAVPDWIFVTQGLPKTRSGKIMRRLLRTIVVGKTDAASLGDTSTLADPSVVDAIIKQVQAKRNAPKSKL